MAKSKYFKSEEEYKKVMSALFDQLKVNEVGKELAKSNLIIKFVYTSPDCSVTLDGKNKPKDGGAYGDYFWNENKLKEDVTLTGTADYSLRFWQGKENPVISIALGKLKAKGNVAAALALLPIIKPAYKLFPKILKEMGRPDLVV